MEVVEDIHKDMRARKLWLSHKRNVENMPDNFDMSNSKDVSTSLVNHFKLSLDNFIRTNAEVEYM